MCALSPPAALPPTALVPTRTLPQLQTVATLYLAYATSMVLRMIPSVVGTAIRDDAHLGIGLAEWSQVLAAGTVGALIGKFVCGWSADRFGGQVTLTAALLVASTGVALFASAHQLAELQGAFFLTLMAQAAGWPSMTKIIANWFAPQQYGRVWGVLATSSRVGVLFTTLLLGSLLTSVPWRSLLWLTAAGGVVVAIAYGWLLRENPAEPPAETECGPCSRTPGQPTGPFDHLPIHAALPRMLVNLRFWGIAGSLMGLAILWDFLLLAPMFLQDQLQLTAPQASRVASAFPLGSLVSVLAGGYVFDRLGNRRMAGVTALLLAVATASLLLLSRLTPVATSGLPSWILASLLFLVLGLCLSPCYYIPASLFSMRFGGRHSGFLVSLLDALGFATTAVFYYFAGRGIETYGWGVFLAILAGIGIWSLITTSGFLWNEGSNHEPVAY
jgi:OPA family sugar phosphate sensor protein UhpC-like MFS transporter